MKVLPLSLAAVLILLIFIELPFIFSAGAVSLIFGYLVDYNLSTLVTTSFRALDSFPLMQIPLYILAGDLMTRAGITEELIKLARRIVGYAQWALGASTVIATVFFGAICGSSVATVSAMGKIMIPRLHHQGYNKNFATSIVTASGIIGILIPPSIPLIMFGLATGASIKNLFIAGIFPGIALAIGLIFYIVARSKHKQKIDPDMQTETVEDEENFKWSNALLALGLPLIIIIGIYGGFVTTTEAAGVAVIYTLIVGSVFLKKLRLRNMMDSMISSGMISASLLLILSFIGMLSIVITLMQIPSSLQSFVDGFLNNRIVFLLIINLILLIVGMFIEENSAILILAPLLAPLADLVGVNIIHLGIIMVFNLGIGLITPPMAANIFVGAKVGNVPQIALIKEILPILLWVCIPVLLAITYVPLLFY